jgi:protein TonB
VKNDPKQKAKPKMKKRPKPKQARKKIKPPDLSTSVAGATYGLDMFEDQLRSLSDSLLDGGGDSVMTEDTVDELPQIRSQAAIEYPESARSAGTSGFVVVKMLITKDGKVRKINIAQSQPQGVFDQVVLATVKTWGFSPAKYQGQPVSVWVEQKLKFSIN